jgi:hypothetical protein
MPRRRDEAGDRELAGASAVTGSGAPGPAVHGDDAARDLEVLIRSRYPVVAPRGLLLVGVQGCGKSLMARNVAAEWDLPLVRLDTGRDLDTDTLMAEIQAAVPLSVTLAESVAALREWARGRAVAAG